VTARVHPVAGAVASFARLLTGVQARWIGCRPEAKQRIYFANHTSHLDFVVLWSALPGDVRAQARPVAAKDYWEKGFRAFLAQRVFRAILIDRKHTAQTAQNPIEIMLEAIGQTESLIFFPEGTRGDGTIVAPFRSGLYHLAKARPDIELVPVYLENLSRILPKGEVLPVPLIGMLTFGAPMQLEQDEDRGPFLERAHTAVVSLRRGGH